MADNKISNKMESLSRYKLLILSCVLSISSVFLHFSIVDNANYGFQQQWYTQIITNTGPYPDQYRVLTYYIAYLLIHAGIPFSIAFSILRFVFTAASFFVLYRYLENWLKPVTALLGIFIMAAVLPATYLFYAMQPADPLNMLVFFLAILILLKKRDIWFLPLVIIGMLNRETAIILPLIFLFVRFGIAPVRYWLTKFFTYSFVSLSIYIGLRIIFGIKAPYAPTSLLHYWWTNLTDWQTWLQLIGFFGFFLLFAFQKWREKPEFLRRMALILPIFFLIHFTVGYMREVRYFIPLLPIILPFALMNLEKIQNSNELQKNEMAVLMAKYWKVLWKR